MTGGVFPERTAAVVGFERRQEIAIIIDRLAQQSG
jgi:hypothetical protein